MDANGVQRTVCVPPTWEGFSNESHCEAARLYPDRFAVMGRYSDQINRKAASCCPHGKTTRHAGHTHAFHQGRATVWLEDGTADWFWDAAERHDVPVMAFAPQAVPKLGEIAERHPGLRLIIDHMGLSSALRGKPLDGAVDNLLKLARLKNVAVKVSALPCYVEEPYPFPTLHPLIRRVVEAFEPRRCFWGTDLSHLTSSYKQCLTLFTEELHFLSDNDKEWILGRGIAEWLDWPLPQQA